MEFAPSPQCEPIQLKIKREKSLEKTLQSINGSAWQITSQVLAIPNRLFVYPDQMYRILAQETPRHHPSHSSQ